MPVASYLILATLLPLAGFLALIFFGRRLARLAGPLATALALGSLALSVVALVAWIAKPEFNQPHYVEAFSYRWLALPNIAPALPSDAPLGVRPGDAPSLTVGFFIDSLTVSLFVLVTLVAALVHLFSITFMAGDPRVPRYFAYLGLLSSSMLALLLANSLLQLFACWQIAGIAAYLLTGFWFERRGPATASLKLALVNSIGDAALLIGLGILAMHVGASGLTFYDAQGTSVLADSVRNALKVQSSEFLYFTGSGPGAFLGLHWLTWVGILLFTGAAAKSAQFPLHVWLPDSVEAPASVAPMIQSGALAVAGVYLIARLYPILTMDARLFIAVSGCVTLLLGALVALVQSDLRRVLAWSTISQLGYMMLFLGAGAYTAGLLHLFTHAFFKTGLLLAAASVLHGLKAETAPPSLDQMGGLWRRLPFTAAAFALFAAALGATPLLAGAYSAQLGLAGVYPYAHALAALPHAKAAMLLFYVPVAGAFLTAFYIMRCCWLVFAAPPAQERKGAGDDPLEQVHESFLFVLPLAILAALSLNSYEFFGLPSLIAKSLPILGPAAPPIVHTEHQLTMARQFLATRQGGYAAWAFLAALPAILLYWNGPALARRLRRLPIVNLLYIWLRESMFLDALYNGVLVALTLLVARIADITDRYLIDGLSHLVILLIRAVSRLGANIDNHIVDGAVTGVAGAARFASRVVLFEQSGRVRVYILVIVGALVALAAVLIRSTY